MIKRYDVYNYDKLGKWCKSEDVQKLEQQNQKLVELVRDVAEHALYMPSNYSWIDYKYYEVEPRIKQIQQPDGGE